MKINKAFAPITIVIETEEDFDNLFQALSVSIFKRGGIFERNCPDKQPGHELYMKLRELNHRG